MEPIERDLNQAQDPPPEVWIQTICRKNSLTLADVQVHKLSTYTQLLLEWNSKVNLISRKDTDNVWKAHILHSLAIPIMVDIPASARVLDLGSGGGLPGVVLKIVRPDLDIVCLDATKKKVDAVEDMIRGIELTGIEAVWGRAEDVGHWQKIAGRFGFVVARAVAPLRDIVGWSRPFLGRRVTEFSTPDSGRAISPPAIVALKGGDLASEIRQTQAKFPLAVVKERALAFHGAELIPGVDKKILTIEL